jgi:hypothetical protein
LQLAKPCITGFKVKPLPRPLRHALCYVVNLAVVHWPAEVAIAGTATIKDGLLPVNEPASNVFVLADILVCPQPDKIKHRDVAA